jgi:hypothetical protein
MPIEQSGNGLAFLGLALHVNCDRPSTNVKRAKSRIHLSGSPRMLCGEGGEPSRPRVRDVLFDT